MGPKAGVPQHIPVLAEAVLHWLQVRESGTYVDCTVGLGGHAVRIASRLKTGRLIALDRDPAAVALARRRLTGFAHTRVLHGNYGELKSLLANLSVERVDGILIDAGVSSMQLDDACRGFSFQEEGPLDMRMDTTEGMTAAGYLDGVSEPELARILKQYGDVGPARRVAAAILRRRDAGRLITTRDLAAAVAEALSFTGGPPEEVRTVFQAIRMAVNEELRWLESGLRQGLDVLAPGGRLVALAFHSGEDRVVKGVFREASRSRRELYADGRVRRIVPAPVRLLTRKPVQPDEDETRNNPRAKSARLRAVERVES